MKTIAVLDHCTCDQLPQFDMDGSYFEGRCAFCTQPLALRTSQDDIRRAAIRAGRKWRASLLLEQAAADYGPWGENL